MAADAVPEPAGDMAILARAASNLDIRAFRRWIECFCIVNFDLELGQTLEVTYPHCELSDSERTTIAFLSFPDSGSNTGNTVFSFRCRRSDGTFIFGFSYFLQEKDPSIPRGYLQKSVVILSTLPYVGLFRRVVSIVGHMFFAYGLPLLEAACQNVSQWPEPLAGERLELPVLGNFIAVHIPSAAQPLLLEPLSSPRGASVSPATSPGLSKDHDLVASMQCINVYNRFFPLLPELWLLWELTLLGEPVILQADTPDVCSDAVFGLVSLVAPLVFGGDFRPFFNIHDADFRMFTEATTEGQQGLILGVTNPFFRKTFGDWPHYVALDCTAGDGHGSFDGGAGGSSGGKKKARGRRRQSYVSTAYKALIQADKAIIKLILTDKTPTGESAAAYNLTLRQHFLELTESVLSPLERYFTTLMPFARAVSAFAPPPRLKSFSRSEFLASLGSAPVAIVRFTAKGAEQSFYARFLGAPNFRSWYRSRRSLANGRIRQLYLHELYHADLPAWLHGKSETQAVELMTRLSEQLAEHPNDPERVRVRIREHLATILAALPEETRAALRPRSPTVVAAAATSPADESELSEFATTPMGGVPPTAAVRYGLASGPGGNEASFADGGAASVSEP